MASNRKNGPVGFVRLIKNGEDMVVVVVIGDRNNWNKKLGTNTIRESIRTTFFELRAKKVISKIKKENRRSIKAFLNAGFVLERDK